MQSGEGKKSWRLSFFFIFATVTLSAIAWSPRFLVLTSRPLWRALGSYSVPFL
ncbi:hypothetical protein BDW71DRAFT_190159, partial [Aspergillus fruticulosus]